MCCQSHFYSWSEFNPRLSLRIVKKIDEILLIVPYFGISRRRFGNSSTKHSTKYSHCTRRPELTDWRTNQLKMEKNCDESERCIQIALKALQKYDIEKARKFFEKAKKLYPTQLVKGNLMAAAAAMQNHIQPVISSHCVISFLFIIHCHAQCAVAIKNICYQETNRLWCWRLLWCFFVFLLASCDSLKTLIYCLEFGFDFLFNFLQFCIQNQHHWYRQKHYLWLEYILLWNLFGLALKMLIFF